MKASNRKKTKSRVLTDTPEKTKSNEFSMKGKEKKAEKSKQVVRNITTRKKEVPVEVESSEDEETYSPDSDGSEISNEICEPEEQAFVCTSLKHGDYVLTKICGKKFIHFYVAEIINIVTNDEFQVKYLKRFGSTTKFVRENEEIFTIDEGEHIFMPATAYTWRIIRKTKKHVDFWD
ncbi:hypothetical protein JTB14_030143 [Gonioctena quinquepunctata]|nr:hypothetical protein JTB14_030143 [Gonioctena quinquepunctata]